MTLQSKRITRETICHPGKRPKKIKSLSQCFRLIPCFTSVSLFLPLNSTQSSSFPPPINTYVKARIPNMAILEMGPLNK